MHGQEWLLDRVVTGRDVAARRDGVQVHSFAEADEVVLTIKGSKTDQYNAGSVRNHYRSGDELCPVRVMAELQRRFPGRFLGGAEVDLPLFRDSKGRLITRTQMALFVKTIAGAVGVRPETVDPHSIRRGGATAMYTGGVEFARIKRFGRWQSDAAHDYLWEAHETQRDLARVMVESTRTLTASPGRGPPVALGGRGGPSSALPTSAQPALRQGGGGWGSAWKYRPLGL